MKFPNLHMAWTAGKKFASLDTISKNTPPEFNTENNRRNTASYKTISCKNKRSPRLECKYAVKTDPDDPQITNLEHFPLYLECQVNHYEVDVLEKSTVKPISYSSWIKNNTQQKSPNQKL